MKGASLREGRDAEEQTLVCTDRVRGSTAAEHVTFKKYLIRVLASKAA